MLENGLIGPPSFGDHPVCRRVARIKSNVLSLRHWAFWFRRLQEVVTLVLRQ